MSGPQFVHLQTWSRKSNPAGQSVAQIIAEVNRDPAFSAHVDDPAPPRVLMGDPSNFEVEHDAHVAARSTVVQMRDGSERERAIRKDRHTLASVVMSYPIPCAVIVTDEQRDDLARWEQRNLEWLRNRFGDQLRVVVAHDDEDHPHIHAWLLPDDPGADATTLHPGKVAKREAEREAKEEDELEPREAVKLGNRALKAAMTTFQDEYHEAVGAPEGLTRSGPQRRRLTREQWKAEKATATAHAHSLARAEKADETADQLDERSAHLDLYAVRLDDEGRKVEKLKAAQTAEKERLRDLRAHLTAAYDAAKEILGDLRQMRDLPREIRTGLRDGLKELRDALRAPPIKADPESSGSAESPSDIAHMIRSQASASDQSPDDPDPGSSGPE